MSRPRDTKLTDDDAVAHLMHTDVDVSRYDEMAAADIDWVLIRRALAGGREGRAAKARLNEAEWAELVRQTIIEKRWSVTDAARLLHTRNDKIKRYLPQPAPEMAGQR